MILPTSNYDVKHLLPEMRESLVMFFMGSTSTGARYKYLVAVRVATTKMILVIIPREDIKFNTTAVAGTAQSVQLCKTSESGSIVRYLFALRPLELNGHAFH